MTKAHRLQTRKPIVPLAKSIPLNFLLGCPERSLANFELARFAAVADARKQMHALLDFMIDQSAQAWLAQWFRSVNREDLRHALENPEDVMAWAQEQIRIHGRTQEEELEPLPSLPQGAAHLAAALRYTERNIAEGKCAVCPLPLDRNSVRYCAAHLAKMRARKGPKGQPGSSDYLYGDGYEDRRARHPGNLAALEIHREKQTRAVLAELGIPPESAAVSLKAAKDAILKCAPGTKADAMTAAELFLAAMVPSPTTGKRAIAELLSERSLQRFVNGGKGAPFRYFAG